MAEMSEERATAILGAVWGGLPPSAKVRLITGAAQSLRILSTVPEIHDEIAEGDVLEQDLPGMWSNSDFSGGEADQGEFAHRSSEPLHVIPLDPPFLVPGKSYVVTGTYEPESLDLGRAAQGHVLRFRQEHPGFEAARERIVRGSQSPDERRSRPQWADRAASVHDRLSLDPDAPWWCCCEDAPRGPHIHCPWPTPPYESGWHVHYIPADQLPPGWQLMSDPPAPEVHYAVPGARNACCGAVLAPAGGDRLPYSSNPDQVICRFCRNSAKFQADLPEPGHDADGIARHAQATGVVIPQPGGAPE